MPDNPRELGQRIVSTTERICIVGQGYVGLPPAVASAEAGSSVFRVDVDKAKLDLTVRRASRREPS